MTYTLGVGMLAVTFRGLEVFVSVVESGGFSAASSALGISQPSVSVHIRDVEAKVGAALFERRPGVPPQLTDAGRSFYTYALETIDRASRVTFDVTHAKRRLRFAAQRFVADQLLLEPLGKFAADYPDIELVARSGTFEEVHALCSRRQVELGFLLSPGDVPGLTTAPLGRYRLALIAAPDHPLANAVSIPITTLATYPFVVAYDTSYFGRTIASMLKAAGLPLLKVASQAQEMSMVRGMVMAGVGVACSLLRSVQKDISAGTLVELDVDIEPMYLVLSYFRNKGSALPEIDQLIETVKKREHFYE